MLTRVAFTVLYEIIASITAPVFSAVAFPVRENWVQHASTEILARPAGSAVINAVVAIGASFVPLLALASVKTVSNHIDSFRVLIAGIRITIVLL